MSEQAPPTLQAPAAPIARDFPTGWIIPTGEVITSSLTGNTYTMGEQIGEGHFGLVYSCVDVWNNELIAKVLKPLAPPEKIRAAALGEFQKLLQLRHPHITYVFDAFEYRDACYIITERCHCPLATVLKIPNYDGRTWLMPIARCLLQAVHYIHLNQYVHQDIHLGNVFAAFPRDEMSAADSNAIQFRLGDLGVAKLFTEIDAKNTRALWMLPPEVIEPSEFGPMDHRIDIYHSGLLFLHVLLGQEMPFTPDEIRTGRPRELALELPAPLSFALEKALRRHVQFRTDSAMEFWNDLNSPELAPQPQPEQLALGPIAGTASSADTGLTSNSSATNSDPEK